MYACFMMWSTGQYNLKLLNETFDWWNQLSTDKSFNGLSQIVFLGSYL